MGEHSQDELVVGVRVDLVGVDAEQRTQRIDAKVAPEPIDVECLVLVVVLEVGPLHVWWEHRAHEAVGHRNDRSVHAGAVAVDESDVAGVGCLELAQETRLEQQVALDED